MEGALVDAMLGTANIDQHPCRSVEHVALGNPALPTTSLFLGSWQDRRQEPRPGPGRTIILRDSAGGLNQGRAVNRVKGALDKLVSHVTEEIERIDHCFRELFL